MLLICVWLIGSLLVLWRFSTPEFGEFDPNGRLPQFSAAAAPWFAQHYKVPVVGSQLLLINQRGCSCANDAASHVSQLQQAVPVEVKTIEVAALPHAIQQDIPATPLLLWWLDGQLKYAGPPATGPWCSMEQDVLLSLLQFKQQLPGLWLNSSAPSCRCLNN